jgi:hypothetical protein
LWIFVFPWYLWAHFKIKAGEAALKDEPLENISSIKRFLRRFSPVAEWALIGIVGLKFIFLFFCIEESWRGPRVWENYKHELEAKGESFDWDAMIPPHVPDSQKFFNAPMMSAWFIKPSGKITINEDLSKRLNHTDTVPAAQIAEVTVGAHPDSKKFDWSLRFDDFKSQQQAKQLIQNIAGPSAFGARGNDILTAQPFNLNQIKSLHIFLEADNKPSVKDLISFFSDNNFGYGPLDFQPDGTNSYHVLASFCDASNYLKWSDQFRGDFDLMREAVKRPYARMDGDYHYPPTLPIPNFVNARAVSQTLAQRAQCYLLFGQPDKALQELTLLNDLRRLMEGAPTGKPMTLVSAMINVAIVGLYVDTIADGFRLHAWKEPQVIALQKQIEQINIEPFVREAFHEEQMSAWRIMQNLKSGFEVQHIPNATLWQKIKNLRPPNIMHGFFYFNVINTVKPEQEIVDSIDLTQKIVLPQKLAELKHEEDALGRHHFDFYHLLAMIAVPNGIKAVQTFAFNQTKADEAQIACALERYRLAHGNYPETLNELVPQFTKKLPHDIIGGQPLKYRRTPDGQFLLYSIGWNETDENGKFNSSYHQGDWIWQ